MNEIEKLTVFWIGLSGQSSSRTSIDVDSQFHLARSLETSFAVVTCLPGGWESVSASGNGVVAPGRCGAGPPGRVGA